jgi:isoleucyl-tRNA synthetase
MSFTPKTDFPLRGNLKQQQIDIRNYWYANNVMQKFFQQYALKTKLLISGPPYANGSLHAGHKVNFILKDIYTLYWRSQGYNVSHFVGFDCHGRPIEYKINPAVNANSNTDTIQKHIVQCYDLATRNIATQFDQLKEQNVFLQCLDVPYYATYKEYATIYTAFSKVLMSGNVYAQRCPMLWSIEDESVISEIETEYKNKISTSVYLKLKLKDADTHVVIWTTTPWTLIDNVAVAYNDTFEYTEMHTTIGRFIVASKLADIFASKLTLHVISTNRFDIQENTLVQHPVDGWVPLVAATNVTDDAGTGFVHTAPAHGLEDAQLAEQHALPIIESVGPNGVYITAVRALNNLHIFKDEQLILAYYSNKIIGTEQYEHKYLFATRSNQPTIYRASQQIFISLKRLNLDPIKYVGTTPTHLADGLYNYILARDKWCVSRNRTWGVPLAVLVHTKTQQIYTNDAFQNAIIDQMAQDPYIFLNKNAFEQFCKKHAVPQEYEVYLGVLDVWFDSACVYDIVTRYLNAYTNSSAYSIPATFIEGIDQKRGWFQSSALLRVLKNESLPFNEIIAHGFVVDAHGRKLSKSLGNADLVDGIINNYGIEILRLRVTDAQYTSEIAISEQSMEAAAEKYKKIRFVFRYMISVVETYIQTDLHPVLPELEIIYLQKLYTTSVVCHEHMQANRFHEAIATVYQYVLELSSDYFNACKSDLYEKPFTSNQHIIYTFKTILIELLSLLKSILSSTTEEIYIHLAKKFDWDILKYGSIHLAPLPPITNYNFDCTEYDTLCQQLTTLLAQHNVFTGYTQNYILHINSRITAATLRRRFCLKDVIIHIGPTQLLLSSEK